MCRPSPDGACLELALGWRTVPEGSCAGRTKTRAGVQAAPPSISGGAGARRRNQVVRAYVGVVRAVLGPPATAAGQGRGRCAGDSPAQRQRPAEQPCGAWLPGEESAKPHVFADHPGAAARQLADPSLQRDRPDHPAAARVAQDDRRGGLYRRPEGGLRPVRAGSGRAQSGPDERAFRPVQFADLFVDRPSAACVETR